MSNYVKVDVSNEVVGWDVRFSIPKPQNVGVGAYKGLEACSTLDKILISKEFSGAVVEHMSVSFSFKSLADLICEAKEQYVNGDLVGAAANFRVQVVEVCKSDSHCDIADTRNPTTKLDWTSKLYTLKYPVVSSMATVFGYIYIVCLPDADWNVKYKAATNGAGFGKQVLGDFSVHNDIVSAKLEAESLYTKYLKSWVDYANSIYLTVTVLERGDDSLTLRTSVGDMSAVKVTQDVSNTGRRFFTGNLILPWSETRVPFVDSGVDKLASLVNSLIADKVDYDLNMLADNR